MNVVGRLGRSLTCRLAGEHGRPRRSVRLLPTVQVVNNPHIILLVSSGEANSRRRLISRAAYNVDLCTLHVELRTHALTRTMQRNQFSTQEILPRRNALGDRNSLHALVGDQAVNAPFAAVEGILGDLIRIVSTNLSSL
jgi:hypothetical protein